MSLREQLITYFDISGLRDLCFELGIDFEELEPGGKSDKVRSLLELLEKDGRVLELVKWLHHHRSDIAWPQEERPISRNQLFGESDRQPLPYEPEFIMIPAGPFLMGSPADEHTPANEQPSHEVSLPSYYIGRFPITHAQYAEFVRQTKHTAPQKVGWFGQKPPQNKLNHPVTGTSWHDALAYCRWLGQQMDQEIRLPTEAEWEKAARGTDGRRYPWGDEWLPSRCNLDAENSTAVDAFPDGASPFGCLDMVGNAAEWTSTLWGTDWQTAEFGYPYRGDGRENPELNMPHFRLFRGTTLGNQEDSQRLRCAARGWYAPDSYDKRRGFRVVMIP